MKKWLCLLLTGVLLLSLTACKKGSVASNQESTDNESTTEHIPASYSFSNVDVNISYTADKSAFSNPITCTYGEGTITVNSPRFTGIPVNSVYYQQNYRFSGNNVTLNVCTKTGGRTFMVDKNGQILDDDYTPVINNSETVNPTDIGAESSAGEGMYVYTDGMLYGLKNSAGTVITKPLYRQSHINFYGGYAVAERADGTYVAIDTAGKEYGTLPGGGSKGSKAFVYQEGEPGNYTQFLYDLQGNRISAGYDSISYFYDGLALIKQGNKIGLISAEGTVVLEPSIDCDTVTYPPKDSGFSIVFLDENAFLLPIGGEIAVITIDK